MYSINNLRSWSRLKMAILQEDMTFLLLQVLVKVKCTWQTCTKDTLNMQIVKKYYLILRSTTQAMNTRVSFHLWN